MPRARNKHRIEVFGDLTALLGNRLKPPFGVVLGSPAEVGALLTRLPAGEPTCYQLDLHPADRLAQELRERGRSAQVETRPDLWDLPATFQTLLYPVLLGGERALKLDMIEQAFHVLAPGGTFVVLSPYERDQFFPQALKKVFGKVHVPMGADNALFWCQRTGERPRRRHEITFQVRVDETTSYRFISRPGVFSYGHFDDGARALTETMEVQSGDRILDLGCGVGTNGILAARQAGPDGFVGFLDSNVRATALATLNAEALHLPHHAAVASRDVTGFDEGSFDVVLANPPYYAQLSIAHLFIERGYAMLKEGGRFFLVGKQAEQLYQMILETFAREPEIYERRGYFIFRCERGTRRLV
jgi:16S rRNA (guanine1207-N2)-methyltransferase